MPEITEQVTLAKTTVRDTLGTCTNCALLKALREGAALCDLDGDILTVNSVLMDLAGAKLGEMVAKYVA